MSTANVDKTNLDKTNDGEANDRPANDDETNVDMTNDCKSTTKFIKLRKGIIYRINLPVALNCSIS